VLENKLQYYGPAMRVNSGDDVATSSKNLLNFCLVTPEMTGLKTSSTTRPKNWHIFLNIFAIFSPYESTLREDDRSVPYFPIYQVTLP